MKDTLKWYVEAIAFIARDCVAQFKARSQSINMRAKMSNAPNSAYIRLR